MKMQCIIKWAAGLFLLAPAAQLAAQDTTSKTLPPITISSTKTKVPEKVWSSFRTYFTNAENPKWYELNKDYLVKFMTDDKTNRALFTKRGTLVYHITYGYENNLPEDVRKLVKSTYYDYTITGVVKVADTDRQVWVVNLENPKTLIMVKLEEGEMEEVQKLSKAL